MSIERISKDFLNRQDSWLVTGAAGFIGSNLVEHLLKLGQKVKGIDNFSTGNPENLHEVRRSVGEDAWRNFELVEGDICDADACRHACDNVRFVLHQAAAVSVPRSFKEPVNCLRTNVIGFTTLLLASREAGVERFVYASSSSVYGDNPALPKIEENIGSPLSPYAMAKQSDEILARMLCAPGPMVTVGLRYFNVFGPRQNAEGDYAAVVPRFIHASLDGRQPVIYGDGETSRDFCFVENVVQANLLAAMAGLKDQPERVFNVAYGNRTTLNELFGFIKVIASRLPGKEGVASLQPQYLPFREGDIRHSLADIARARRILGYSPSIDVKTGLELLITWTINAKH